MSVFLLFVAILGFLLIGTPIAIALGLASLLFLLWGSDGSLASMAQILFDAFEGHQAFLAIPFFILASHFMISGGIARRIIRFSIACTGHLPGGLAIAGVFACMLFAAISGSSPATVVAVGSIVMAAMRQAGYDEDFAAAVICSAGTLGILIPPSIIMVVYATAVEVSIGRMFMAGILPGLLAGLILMGVTYAIARVKALPCGQWQGWGEVMASARQAGWGLLLIVIVLGGIYGGVFTPTEAAAVSAVYAFFVACFLYRDIGPLAEPSFRQQRTGVGGLFWQWPWIVIRSLTHPDTIRILFEAGKITITLLFVIANALILKHVLTIEHIPQQVAASLLASGFGPITFLLIVNALLLIGGQFMEPSGLLLIVAPLVFPIAMALGIDPIHLGIIMVVNMEIGMITPPVGLNLFVTSGVARLPITRVTRASLPYLLVLLLFLLIVTYIPWLSTVLPHTFMGPETVSIEKLTNIEDNLTNIETVN